MWNHCRICGYEKAFLKHGVQACKVCFTKVCIDCINDGICSNCKEAIIEKPKDNDKVDLVLKSKHTVLPVVPLGAFPKCCQYCKHFRDPFSGSVCVRNGWEFGVVKTNICWCFERY